jgi:hypothetical protein
MRVFCFELTRGLGESAGVAGAFVFSANAF